DSLARYKLLADHATDIISRQTIAGEYIYVSPACYEVLGYQPEELVGRSRYEFIHPEDVAHIQQTISQIDQQPETFPFVFRARHKAGHYVWMEAIQRKLYKEEDLDDYRIIKPAANSLPNLPTDAYQQTSSQQTSSQQPAIQQLQSSFKAVKEIIVVARDITERILAQQKIQQFNVELKGRVTRRTQELEASQERYLDLLKIEREGYARAELAKATAQLYAEAVENMQVGLYIWQLTDFDNPASLTMVATNQAASEFTGIPMEEVIGQRILAAFPALTDTDIPETYAGVVKSKMMVDLGEVSYGDSRVEKSTFAVKAFPLTEDCVGISFDDITERKKAEAIRLDQAAQLKILFDQAAVGMGRVSLEGQWIQVNQRLCDLLGYSMPELLGKNYRALTHPEDLKTSQTAYEQLIDQRQPQVNYEKRYLTHDGETLWAYVTVSTFREAGFPKTDFRETDTHSSDGDNDTNPLYFIVTVQDITERKQAVTALKRQKNDLVAVNVMLTNTMSQLEQRNNELDQFAYVTSHDLKAPLRAIANLSSWIEEDLGDKLPAENKEQFDLLKNRVLRMEGFIDGLLEYSRIGRTHQGSELVDVAALLADILDSISPLGQFSVEIVSPMPTLEVKRVPLIQVFSNLIVNAIKHHDRKDGRVQISAIEHDDSYEFLIADDGPGIDAIYHDKIFTIFQTLRSRDDLESTGIGLSLVKKTVKAEGGEVSVSSEEGKGATFSFTWPKEPHVGLRTYDRLASSS
ncbi:MAG: PAS domain S-box protein, partial [Phormidesmis sp.]